jgi:hypothetical protein
MELDYFTFEDDCLNIIEPYLKKYGYVLDASKSEKFINMYKGKNGYVEISMLSSFPFICVSYTFLTLNDKCVKVNLLEKKMGINRKEITLFYNDFSSRYDTLTYIIQMRYVIEVMEIFYRPVLMGEIELENLTDNP